MGLSDVLDRIKEAIGIGGSRDQQSERRSPQDTRTGSEAESNETTVTVEREPSTETEDAVKGTDTDTESDSEGSSESGPAATPDEGADGDDDGLESDAESATSEGTGDEPDTDGESDTSGEQATTEADLGTDESTDVIKGIGSTYADRLADAGVETVADLAGRDAETLAEETDISEKRLGTWIKRAKHRGR